MKRYHLNINQHIQGWYIDPKVCDDMIDLFKNNPEFYHPGRIGPDVDITRKHSTDITVSPLANDNTISNYLNELESCINDYKLKYPVLDSYGPWGITEEFLIQWYKPNEGFYEWHAERGTATPSKRILVFMTYLNDVTDEGETEFKYQQLKTKPEKGLTLIWPTDFTHLHRGIPSKTQDKYIVTGWYSFK